jgi:hypothetical protein
MINGILVSALGFNIGLTTRFVLSFVKCGVVGPQLNKKAVSNDSQKNK